MSSSPLNNLIRLMIIIFGLAVVVVVYLSHQPPVVPPKPPDLFTQVSQHNNQSDCWIIYQDHIYNITSYFGSHPGGDEAIVSYCGKDATAAFDSKGKNPPKSHSSSAKELLSQFLIK